MRHRQVQDKGLLASVKKEPILLRWGVLDWYEFDGDAGGRIVKVRVVVVVAVKEEVLRNSQHSQTIGLDQCYHGNGIHWYGIWKGCSQSIKSLPKSSSYHFEASKLFYLHQYFRLYIILIPPLLTYPTLFKVQIFPSYVGFLHDCAIGVQISLHPSQDSNSGDSMDRWPFMRYLYVLKLPLAVLMMLLFDFDGARLLLM